MDPSLPSYKFQLSKLEELLTTFNQNLPRVKPFYAVKALCHEKVLKKMGTLGFDFDCASKGEIEMIQRLCPGAEIIYANTMRPSDHLLYAATHGIQLYTFDCMNEADNIFRATCRQGKLIMRLSVDNPHSGCNFGEKFGVLKNDIPSFIEQIKQKQMTIFGLSFHVGSGNTDFHIFNTAIQFAFEVNQEIVRKIPNHPPIELLDIGGGFIHDEHFPLMASGINEALTKYFPLAEYPQLKIIAEPGRYFSEPLMTGEFTITCKRFRQGKICYTINDSIYGVFCCAMHDYKIFTEKDIRFPPSNKNQFNAKKLSIVFGQTCDSGDVLARNVYLPEMEVGDKIEFVNMGAYGIELCSAFNGFQNGTIVFVEE